MSKKGRLIVVSGTSGAGKGTIIGALMAEHPDEYVLSVSATTRAARVGEEHGVHYFFLSHDEFDAMIERGEFLEHAEYVGNKYGTPAKWVEERLNEGRDVILEIEINGAMQIKSKVPEALLVFVSPPSLEELRNRLIKRGTETEEQISARIAKAEEELKHTDEYDVLIVNEDIEKSVNLLHNIVHSKSEKKYTGEKSMLHPSYTDLMDAVNSEVEEGEDPIVQSRYSIVMAASKRARQLVDGAAPLVDDNETKPLSVAVDEIYNGKVTISVDDTKK